MNYRLLAVLAFVAVASIGCRDDDTGPTELGTPTPGWLDVRLEAPHSTDGGVLFRVYGAQIDSVSSRRHAITATSADKDRWTVLAVGELVSGPIARIRVPDVNQAPRYEASIQQAATRAAYEQQAVSSFSVTVEQQQ